MVRKISISIGEELDAALGLAAIRRHENKSTVIDTLLREHPVIQGFVAIVRAESASTGPLLGSTMVRSVAEKAGRRSHNQPGRRLAKAAH